MSKQVIYTALDYEGYKELEIAMIEFRETVHTSTGGFYHKSIRLPIGDGVIMEFHGPLVLAGALPFDPSDGGEPPESLTGGEKELAVKVAEAVAGVLPGTPHVKVTFFGDHPTGCDCIDCANPCR